ncbi:helix-turn-helix domain-containing protein [Myroides indicus]|nr:AraC family transcriptional regulator [Myroides indicus]
MEPELFEELISVIDYFWHRYAGLPFTSKYSIPVRTSYFKQSDSVLSALLRFCIAANFLRLHNYTLQDLIKHRFAIEYNPLSHHWKWVEASKLSKKYKQNVLNRLECYTQHLLHRTDAPQVISVYLTDAADEVHYISGTVRRFQTPDRLVFVLFSLVNKYTDSLKQPPVYIADKEKLRQLYELYIRNPEQNLQDFIREQGLNYRQLQNGFRQCFGTTFCSYHHQIKLILSLAEIMFTNKSLKEIAYDAGYENYISYYRSFVKNFSKTPKEVLRFGTTFF